MGIFRNRVTTCFCPLLAESVPQKYSKLSTSKLGGLGLGFSISKCLQQRVLLAYVGSRPRRTPNHGMNLPDKAPSCILART